MALRSRLLQTAILLAAGTITVSSFGVNSPIQSQTLSAFVRSASPSVSSSPSKLNMMEECPEIPFTAQLDPKYDTCIIALG